MSTSRNRQQRTWLGIAASADPCRIRLNWAQGMHSTKPVKNTTASTRKRILYRDEYTCQECGGVSLKLEIDHITPLDLGGLESDENRQALCKGCHKVKTTREGKDRMGGRGKSLVRLRNGNR